ncbi:hypothetical protein ACFLV4_05280, partial [Chloroflexota bacterium]
MRWIVSAGTLSLELGNENVAVPSARQIYQAEFTGKTCIDDIEVTIRPSQDIPELSISKYPLDLYILINPPKAEISLPATCSVLGIRNEKRIRIRQLFCGNA